jgi:hypothetical protein
MHASLIACRVLIYVDEEVWVNDGYRYWKVRVRMGLKVPESG